MARIWRAHPAIALAARLLTALLLAAVLLPAASCERSAQEPATRTVSDSTAQDAGSGFAQPATVAAEPVILMLGDSLTAGFGLPTELSFPSLIQTRLRQAGYPHKVVNAGVSGDTSAGGLSRLDWLLRQRVDVLLLALGANDGLRGQDPDAMRANLARIIERARGEGIRVVLAGMRMPLNYGLDYTRRYQAVFGQLADQYALAFIPFLLEGVALKPALNQADGIHPNAEGARIVADTVWLVLKDVL